MYLWNTSRSNIRPIAHIPMEYTADIQQGHMAFKVMQPHGSETGLLDFANSYASTKPLCNWAPVTSSVAQGDV